MKTILFMTPLTLCRKGYYNLNIKREDVHNTIYNDEEFSHYADKIENAFTAWCEKVDNGLRNIDVKTYIIGLSDQLINEYTDIQLVDKHDFYEVLLSYWQNVMAKEQIFKAFRNRN